MSTFHDNKTSNFKVNLPKPLELDPTKWEVALSEIQFPHSWYNIQNGRNVIKKDVIQPTVEELNILFPIPKEKIMKSKLIKEDSCLKNNRKIHNYLIKQK